MRETKTAVDDCCVEYLAVASCHSIRTVFTVVCSRGLVASLQPQSLVSRSYPFRSAPDVSFLSLLRRYGSFPPTRRTWCMDVLYRIGIPFACTVHVSTILTVTVTVTVSGPLKRGLTSFVAHEFDGTVNAGTLWEGTNSKTVNREPRR